MAWSRRRLAIWACVVGVVTLAMGIGVATAAKLKTKSASTTLPSGGFDSATAKCKRGTKAVSGGFVSPFDPNAPLPEQPNVLVGQSSRTSGRGWTSRAHNNSPAEGMLTSFAYCRDERVKRRSATTEIGADELGSATAHCRKGTKAISGGFDAERIDTSLPEFPIVSVIASRKLGKRRWQVSAFNFGDVRATSSRRSTAVRAES
jgi:hypothetical protein